MQNVLNLTHVLPNIYIEPDALFELFDYYVTENVNISESCESLDNTQ